MAIEVTSPPAAEEAVFGVQCPNCMAGLSFNRGDAKPGTKGGVDTFFLNCPNCGTQIEVNPTTAPTE
jgi:hypothetical protein